MEYQLLEKLNNEFEKIFNYDILLVTINQRVLNSNKLVVCIG